MGIKKSCSCGFWNQDQQECLYNGHDCFYKEIPAKKATVDYDWIKLKAWWLIERIEGECGELKELQRIGIYHLLTEKGDLQDILTLAGVEVVEK